MNFFKIFNFLLFFNLCSSNKISIIGGGYSGLVAGIEMSQKGYNVTIYEKNNFIGGRSYESLINDKYRFDMGPSWYWMPEIYDKIFERFDKNNEIGRYKYN